MNGAVVLRVDRPFFIDGLAEHIEYPAEAFLADRHRDGSARIDRFHAANKTVGGRHRDTTDYVVSNVLGHLDHEVDPLLLILNFHRMIYLWQIIGEKLHVDHRPDDLDNLAYIHFALLNLSCRRIIFRRVLAFLFAP